MKRETLLERLWRKFADLFPGEPGPLIDRIGPPSPPPSGARATHQHQHPERPNPLKCISIKPPWAWCVIHLPGSSWKDVENRSRNSLHRGPLLIHASGNLTHPEHEEAAELAREAGCPADQLPTFATLARLRGGIIGAVEMFDVSAPGFELDDRPSSPWREDDCFAYHLRGRVVLPHRPLLGKLGIYEVPLTPAETRLLDAAKRGGLALPVAAP